MSQREGDVLSDARLTTLYQPLFVFLPRVVREPLYARMVFVRRDVMLPQQAMFATDTVLMDLP
jgi:hypothetical protein